MNEIIEAVGQEVYDNCKKLNINLQLLDNPEISTMARSMAYEPSNYGAIYSDGTQGILVKLPEEKNTYNNGVYMLHLAKDTATPDAYSYILEVIVPNSNDRSGLIRKTIGDITMMIENLDTSDLDVYDFANIYGTVIANTVVKHLARSLYPDQKDKQIVFTNLYLSRFLAHTAHIYAGSEQLKEETVNSDPYLFKLAIDGLETGEIVPNPEMTGDDADV